MFAAIALLLQASTVAAAPSPPPQRIDLLRSLAPPKCEPGAEGEIVVCGSRDRSEPYRLEPLPPRYVEKPLTAETRAFGNVRAGVTTESASVGGFTSNRVMVRFKLPF